MPEEDTFSVRLEPDEREKLDSLAASMDRPRSHLVAQAIDHFLDYHGDELFASHREELRSPSAEA